MYGVIVNTTSILLQCVVSVATTLPSERQISTAILILLYLLIFLFSIVSEIIDHWTFAQVERGHAGMEEPRVAEVRNGEQRKSEQDEKV